MGIPPAEVVERDELSILAMELGISYSIRRFVSFEMVQHYNLFRHMSSRDCDDLLPCHIFTTVIQKIFN